MRKLALGLSVVAAFGAGMAFQSLMFVPEAESARAPLAAFSPETLQRSIDARTLPETQVADYN